MSQHEIIKRIIGPIDPLGDASRDPERFDNLKNLCLLLSNLFEDVDRMIRNNQHSNAASIKKSVDFAKNFLRELHEEEEINLIEWMKDNVKYCAPDGYKDFNGLGATISSEEVLQQFKNQK